MKTISIVTGTRAEYGLLKPLILELLNIENFDLKLAVTGMHLSPEFGYTYKEIEKDGIVIDEKIEILLSSDSRIGVAKAMGLSLISFSEYFNRIKPDLLVILGDRFEIFSASLSAMNLHIPIAHIHGGETTQGALDEAMRHSITKMSQIHFPCSEEYKNRIIQLGEQPESVYNVGALAVDIINKNQFLPKKKLEKILNMSLKKPYFIVIFHSETLEKNGGIDSLKTLLRCTDCFREYNFIFILGNADFKGRELNNEIIDFGHNRDNIYIFQSLRHIEYLSVLKNAVGIIGNSSSGIIEACCLNVPAINIGDRQKGRAQGKNIINITGKKVEINDAIKEIINPRFGKNLKPENPYGDGFTAKKIVTIIEEYLEIDDKNFKKIFHDSQILKN